MRATIIFPVNDFRPVRRKGCPLEPLVLASPRPCDRPGVRTNGCPKFTLTILCITQAKTIFAQFTGQARPQGRKSRRSMIWHFCMERKLPTKAQSTRLVLANSNAMSIPLTQKFIPLTILHAIYTIFAYSTDSILHQQLYTDMYFCQDGRNFKQ